MFRPCFMWLCCVPIIACLLPLSRPPMSALSHIHVCPNLFYSLSAQEPPTRPFMQPSSFLHVPWSVPQTPVPKMNTPSPFLMSCHVPSCPPSCQSQYIFPVSVVPPHPNHHKLNRSKLNLSPLLTLLTTPNLKNFSSPVAVLPPIYNFSAPNASRNPSLLLSLPRLRPLLLCCWGMGIGPW